VKAAPTRSAHREAVELSPLVSRRSSTPFVRTRTSAAPRSRSVPDVASSTRSGFAALDGLLLVGIVGMAAFLRLWNLGRVGFRGDEAVYAGQAAVLAGVEDLQRYFILLSRGNSNFLLYQHVVAVVYRLLGVTDVNARIVSATFSILTVVATFLIARVLYDRRTALYAALFLAVSSYSVTLGRLALLDPTFTFLFTMAILFLLKWGRTGRTAWFCGFAATAALTIQAKVVGLLLFAVCGLYLLLSRSSSRLNLRAVLLGAAVFLVFFAPALLQVAHNSREFTEFLSRSSQRVSSVPWYYYPRTLLRYEGPVVAIGWVLGIAAVARRRSRADLMPVIWIAVVAGFYQLYPLKAFNYVLPLMPVLSLLAARVASSLHGACQRIVLARNSAALAHARVDGAWRTATDSTEPAVRAVRGGRRARLRRSRVLATRVSTAAVLSVLVAGVALPQWRALHDDSFAGLKEAAQWLAAESPANTGVMALSQGSSQYVFAFYAKRDSYPFGRFRLATVLPGGTVVNSSPTADGSIPRDWVTDWPPRLIESGAVSYLVYFTGPVDDPPEESQLVETATQRKFREFIESYGGKLVHTIYRNQEGRVWIYQVQKRLPKPVVTYAVRQGSMTLSGEGFQINSPVTVYYHQRPVARAHAGSSGSFSVKFLLPKMIRSNYFLTVSDDAGNYTSFSRLSVRTQAT